LKKNIAIIGGGISGLAAGFYAKLRFGDSVDMAIFEKENRLGGTIGITRKDGYLADWGPNGFLDREPLTLELVKQVGLQDRLYPSNAKSEKRFIYRAGRLWEISTNPAKFMTSGLLSLKGRLRIAAEYFIPGKKDDRDETIFDFAARRIGREAAEILIDPMVSGIFGGDASQLSLGACFPIMEKMERDYGGLIKAMIKKRKERERHSATSGGGPAGPAGHLTSFKGGLYTIIEELEKKLAPDIRRAVDVRAIIAGEKRKYRLIGSKGGAEYDHIIIATPSYIAAQLLKNIASRASALLEFIPYSNMAVVCQGYRISDIERELDGFGFLVPHNQNLEILGSIWTSVIFPEQAPEGFALFRTMLGGAKRNEIVELGEERLGEIAHRRLSKILRIKVRPAFQEVIVWKKAIPQYILGHRERLREIDADLRGRGGLYLAGNAYSGVGLNDAVKRSYNIVQAIVL
jgi:oxygen-dependent protoporphyrinogen oxidase